MSSGSMDQYLKVYGRSMSSAQKKVFRAIHVCRTAALGGHLDECDRCGHRQPSYNSCRDRHCPKCQAAARAEWFEKRQSDLLAVDYYHVVFTLPEEIRPIALQNRKVVYGILFRAASETLRHIAKDPKHLGAEIGFLGVLHTWSSNLLHHPHLHFVCTGGGLSPDKSKWISCPKNFFLPVEVLSLVFRGKFLNFLEKAYEEGKLSFYGSLNDLSKTGEFKSLLVKACKCRWVVYSKPPFAEAQGAELVLKYLARYTHRVAISNTRLIAMKDGKVTFRWKDYADGSRQKTMTLDAIEFIRRFLLHVLPSGFMRIRYYGLLSSRNRQDKLKLCRELIGEDLETFQTTPTGPDTESDETLDRDNEFDRCPVCKTGRMVRVEKLDPIPTRQPTHQLLQPVDSS